MDIILSNYNKLDLVTCIVPKPGHYGSSRKCAIGLLRMSSWHCAIRGQSHDWLVSHYPISFVLHSVEYYVGSTHFSTMHVIRNSRARRQFKNYYAQDWLFHSIFLYWIECALQIVLKTLGPAAEAVLMRFVVTHSLWRFSGCVCANIVKGRLMSDCDACIVWLR